MTWRLATVAFVALTGVWCTAQQPPALARADQFFATLERSLRNAPDVRPYLADSAPVTASILRKEPRMAKAWQLEPMFAGMLADVELRDYVVVRANLALVCGLDVMRQVPLATITRQQVEKLNPRQFYVPEAAGAGLDPDCVTLDSRSQQRGWVTSRPQLNTWLRLSFNPLVAKEKFAARGVQQGDTLLESNLSYLRSVARGAQPDPEVAAAAGLPPDAVAVGSVINLMAYVRLDRPSPQLLLVTPLSW
jgi:hypothetical protein